MLVSVDPGKHRLKVEKNGFSLFTKEFEIESGGEKVIAAHLEPLTESSPSVAEPAPEAKLIDHARWALDEGQGIDAKDTGKGRGSFHGILKNMAPNEAWSEDVPPTKAPNRYSLKFDGEDDYIEVEQPAKVSVKGTFAAWIKTENASDDMELIGTAERCAFGISINGAKENLGEICLYLRDSDGRTFERHNRQNASLCDGRWHHLGVTWNGTDQIVRIYVDGVNRDVVWVDEGSKGTPYNFEPFENALRIGDCNWYNQPTNETFDGLMDDVQLIGRDLSDSEIQELAARRDEDEAEMSQPVPATALDSPSPEPNPAGENTADIPNEPQQPAPEAKLIDHARWNFDEGKGNVAKDSGEGRGGFHGVLKNMSPEDAWSEDVPPTKAPNRFSLKLDGVDDFVEVAEPMKLYAEGSFAAWIKTENTSESMELIGIRKWDYRNNLSVTINESGDADGIRLWLMDSEKRWFRRWTRQKPDCSSNWTSRGQRFRCWARTGMLWSSVMAKRVRCPSLSSAGKYRLNVSKTGFKPFVADFSIASG